ncbi:MAG: DUF4271 domain-containing protein [Flavobacteriaceae bacterium]|nr:DUF4271 domain-containing protein [Flavobacteriaceae bacterium]
MEYILRTVENWDWVTLLLVGTFIILATTRYIYPRKFMEFLYLPLSDKYFKTQGKNHDTINLFNILIFSVKILSLSLFLYLYIYTVQPATSQENPWLFIQIITGLGLFILAKFYLEKILGHILNIEVLINDYLHEKLSYASIISLLVLVGNIIFYFTFKPSETTLLGFSITLASLYLISLISSFKRNRNIILKHFSYFILYLCALEIAPYIILYHVVLQHGVT